jgi:hypothetical protein
MLESVTDEVPLRTRKKNMDWLRRFQDRAGYHVHTAISTHRNDVRLGVNWPDLFEVWSEADRRRRK